MDWSVPYQDRAGGDPMEKQVVDNDPQSPDNTYMNDCTDIAIDD
jgi:hypothetical protein